MPLTEAELARYAPQLAVPGFTPAAQDFLRAARVQVVGAGEVAGPAMRYLAAAGVGTLYVDDPLDVAPEEGASWLFTAAAAGQPRCVAAMAALQAATTFVRVRPYSTGSLPTAVLVAGGSAGPAREAAERARVAGLPHVVALADGDGGEVVCVPPGAPCYACGSRPGTGALPRPGAAEAIGALAALELTLLISGALPGPPGRRIDLVMGFPQALATARVPGCACGQGRGG